MPDVYACRLPLGREGSEAFERAVRFVKAEVARLTGLDLPEGWSGSHDPRPGVSLRWRLLEAPGLEDRLWTLSWEQALAGDPDTAWVLTVQVGVEDGATWVVVRLGQFPRGRRMARIPPDVEPPWLVPALLANFNVVEDGWQLLPEPWYAEDRDGAVALADLLLDRDRVLPVVVVSSARARYHPEHRSGPIVDAERLAASLVGLAHVAVLDSVSASFAVTDVVGPHLAVFGGAVRLYWPGLDRRSEPGHHPLWVPQALGQPANRPFHRVLLRHLGGVAAARFATTPLEARIRAELERQRRAEMASLWSRAKEASLAPEWQEELERAWAENERLREENQGLLGRLAVAEDNVRALSMNRVTESGSDAEVAGDDAQEAPRTVAEAVEWAAERCPHLVVLDDAIAAARRSPYRQPGRVWQALRAMDDVAAAWDEGQLPGGFREAFTGRGFDFASNVSPSALGRYPQDYERTYDGRVVALGPHLGLGRGSPEACCRVYWYLDEDRRRFVVGHVGHHLRDSTT